MTKKDPLAEYKKKRDLKKTPEPSGKKKRKGKKPLFVIQKHDASSLHYDFRIEIEGVLKSWAVPKGPSTDPREKRLAILTEDHPMDYADFEGVIPKGEYGAGAVLVWDKGTYKNLKKDKNQVSMKEAFEDGHIEIFLEGKKLRGGYALIKTSKGKKDQWLLIKMKDEEADARRKPVSTKPESVLTGRNLKEIKKEEKGSESDEK